MWTYVFVYGTLKRGLYNYDSYLRPALTLGKAQFVGQATTSHADFHMVLNNQLFYPCLFRAASSGRQVPGDVFRVDADTLAALDLLEQVDDDLYRREQVSVELLSGKRKGETVGCQIYLAPVTQELLALERIRDYTAEMNAKFEAHMDGPEPEILACISGKVRADETN